MKLAEGEVLMVKTAPKDVFGKNGKVIDEFGLTGKIVDDIMVTALEGGISYWCREARVIGNYLGEMASDQISRGGLLKLYDFDGDAREITLEKFIEGTKELIALNPEVLDSGSFLDPAKVDAAEADTIIQFAAFGELVYG